MGGAPPGAGGWSSTQTAVIEREEAVREILSGTHLPWDLRLEDPSAYELEVTWHQLGDATVVDCRSAPLRGRRATPELRRTDQDTVGVLLVTEGRERVRQGDTTAELTAGDVLCWHSAAPVQFEVVEAVRKVTLLVPTDRLAVRTRRGRVGPVALPASSALGRLLAGHLRTLAEVGGQLGTGDALLAVDVALDLLVRGAEPVSGGPGGAVEALAARALTAIETDLDDPDLTPTALAGRLGVSPRYLHLAFASTGTTVAAHIRRRRLERIARDLADPRLAAWSLTDLAHRWGFGDASQLSRAFRAVYAETPSAYRRRVAPQK